VLTGLVAALVTTACTVATATGADGPASGTAAAPSTTADAGTRPVGPAGTGTQRSAGGYPGPGRPFGALTDVRVAAHDGFDRIVLQFEGEQVPAHQVGYVAPPVTADGSGDVVAVDGAAFLQIALTPTSGVDLEAVVTWTAGTTGELPFAVAELSGPARLVVDVLHPGGGAARSTTAPS
jgi:hypothetical protein